MYRGFFFREEEDRGGVDAPRMGLTADGNDNIMIYNIILLLW